VEVSLDGGKLWRQAEITRFETPNPGGKLWCWIFWRFEVRLNRFRGLETGLNSGCR
jgi:hypothetical protein